MQPGFEKLLADLQPTLEAMERRRIKTLQIVAAVCMVFVLLWGGFCYFQLGKMHWSFDIGRLFVVVTLVFCIDSYYIITQGFRRSFREQIMRPFLALLDPSFVYDPDKVLREWDFLQSELFKTPHHFYKGRDHVTGRMGEIRLTFSEVDATKIEPPKRAPAVIFRGLFAVVDFPRKFQGSIYVLPDQAEAIFGKLGQEFQERNQDYGQLIRMEDPEFEKHFVVYGSDQIEARYILSTSMMQRITAYRKKAGVKLSLAFKDSKLYMAFHYSRPLFEPRMTASLKDESTLQSYLADLALILGIVDELKLNLNVWDTPQRKAV